MKWKQLTLSLVGMATLILCAVSIKAAENDYSGIWVLDKGATKGLSSHVRAYDMVVTQDGQQLVVTTQTEGQLTVGEQGSRTSDNTNALARAEAPQGPKTAGLTMVGSPGTMGDNSLSNGSLAFRTVVPQATYTLDGKKTTVNLVGFGQATLTAKPGKNGKSLDLSMTHQETVGGQLMTALVAKERWTLSDDGQVLKVQRTVSTQQTSETVNLVFRKKSGTP
jgi:hypothetical protein